MLSNPPRTAAASAAPASAAAALAVSSHMSSGSGAPWRQVRRATPMMQVARGSGGKAVVRSGARLAGHGDGAVRDDVLLDLGRAAADGGVALKGEETGPLPAVHGVGAALGQHAR